MQQAKNAITAIQLPDGLSEDSRSTLMQSFTTLEDYYTDQISGINSDLEKKFLLLRNEMPFGGDDDTQKMQDAADAIDNITKVLVDLGISSTDIQRMEKKEKKTIK